MKLGYIQLDERSEILYFESDTDELDNRAGRGRLPID